jgi:Peptidase_C39 like family
MKGGEFIMEKNIKIYWPICFCLFIMLSFLGCGGGGGGGDSGGGSTTPPPSNPNVVTLNVPFEPNHGGTCASSSMTMILKYNGLNVTFDDVYKIAGPPPIINYSGVDQWIQKDFGLTLKLYPNRTVQDIIKAIDLGYPVMVLQVKWTNDSTGHNRVVIGYDLDRNEFIVNDPSDFGPNFRIPFATFEELWRLWNIVEPSWPPNFLWLIIKVNTPDPI